MLAVIEILSFTPNRTTSFGCKNMFEVHVSKVFTWPPIFILKFTSYYFSSSKNVGSVNICSLCLEHGAVPVIKITCSIRTVENELMFQF